MTAPAVARKSQLRRSTTSTFSLFGTMAGYAWLEEEEILVLYFTACRFSTRAQVDLLGRRGFQRSRPAIESKYAALINDRPELRIQGAPWDIAPLDQWIAQHGLDAEYIYSLLDLTDEDYSILDQVCYDSHVMFLH